jgi:hydrogenase nickel incorporation protein HypA/HybF
MHEVSVAMALYRACRDEVDARGGGRLKSVTAVVGELSGTEPDLLALAWEPLVAGGPDDGALLTIDWRPAEQVCPNCGPVAERQPGTWLRLCPACSSPLMVRGGRELSIAAIEFSPAPALAGLEEPWKSQS